MNLRSILGWFLLPSVDQVCLLKVSPPLSVHHYSLMKADRWFHLAQLQVISCFLVFLLNVPGVLLRMSRTFQNYVLRHLHQNKWADCLLCVWGRQIMQSPSFLNFIASLSLWPHKSAVILWVFIQNREESTERLIGSSGQMRHSRKTGIYTHHTFHSSIKS